MVNLLFFAFSIFSVIAGGLPKWQRDFGSRCTPCHPFSLDRLGLDRKGEQSLFIYVGHFFFFLTLWPICIASLSIFHTLLHLPNTFLRPILYNAMIQTYVRVSPSFLLPACHWEAFCIVPGLLNYTMSPQLSTSII